MKINQANHYIQKRSNNSGSGRKRKPINNVVQQIDYALKISDESDEIFGITKRNNSKLFNTKENNISASDSSFYEQFLKKNSPLVLQKPKSNDLLIDKYKSNFISNNENQNRAYSNDLNSKDSFIVPNLLNADSKRNVSNVNYLEKNDLKNDETDFNNETINKSHNSVVNDNYATYAQKNIYLENNTQPATYIKGFEKVNESPAFKDIEKEYSEYSDMLRKLPQFIYNLKSEYINMFNIYKKMAADFNSQISTINDLNTKTVSQIDLINTNQDKISDLLRENEKLKNEYNLLNSYKKEVEKYIETIKSTIELKNSEVLNLNTKNLELQQENHKMHFLVETLKQEIYDRKASLTALENEKLLISNQVDNVKHTLKKITLMAKNLASKYLESHNSVEKQKNMHYEGVINIIGSEISVVQNYFKNIRKVVEILKDSYKNKIEEANLKEIEIEKYKARIDKLNEEKKMIHENYTKEINILNDKIILEKEIKQKEINEIKKTYEDFIRELICNTSAKYKSFKTFVGDKLENIQFVVKNLIGLNIIDKFKKTFASMINNQRQQLTTQKNKYEMVINNLKSRKIEPSSDSDIWDAFK